ncbi:unnamed protein product [Amoebophrya sp. A120]|nr:unnamed protein product [Amoebophrya sp. A120]|eukprot:GSA120T00015822001.1
MPIREGLEAAARTEQGADKYFYRERHPREVLVKQQLLRRTMNNMSSTTSSSSSFRGLSAHSVFLLLLAAALYSDTSSTRSLQPLHLWFIPPLWSTSTFAAAARTLLDSKTAAQQGAARNREGTRKIGSSRTSSRAGKKIRTGSTSTSRARGRQEEARERQESGRVLSATTASCFDANVNEAPGFAQCSSRGFVPIPDVPIEVITCAGGVFGKDLNKLSSLYHPKVNACPYTSSVDRNWNVHILQRGWNSDKKQTYNPYDWSDRTQWNADEFVDAKCFGTGADYQIATDGPEHETYVCYEGSADVANAWHYPAYWSNPTPFANTHLVRAAITQQEQLGNLNRGIYLQVSADPHDDTKFNAQWFFDGTCPGNPNNRCYELPVMDSTEEVVVGAETPTPIGLQSGTSSNGDTGEGNSIDPEQTTNGDEDAPPAEGTQTSTESLSTSTTSTTTPAAMEPPKFGGNSEAQKEEQDQDGLVENKLDSSSEVGQGQGPVAYKEKEQSPGCCDTGAGTVAKGEVSSSFVEQNIKHQTTISEALEIMDKQKHLEGKTRRTTASCGNCQAGTKCTGKKPISGFVDLEVSCAGGLLGKFRSRVADPTLQEGGEAGTNAVHVIRADKQAELADDPKNADRTVDSFCFGLQPPADSYAIRNPSGEEYVCRRADMSWDPDFQLLPGAVQVENGIAEPYYIQIEAAAEDYTKFKVTWFQGDEEETVSSSQEEENAPDGTDGATAGTNQTLFSAELPNTTSNTNATSTLGPPTSSSTTSKPPDEDVVYDAKASEPGCCGDTSSAIAAPGGSSSSSSSFAQQEQLQQLLLPEEHGAAEGHLESEHNCSGRSSSPRARRKHIRSTSSSRRSGRTSHGTAPARGEEEEEQQEEDARTAGTGTTSRTSSTKSTSRIAFANAKNTTKKDIFMDTTKMNNKNSSSTSTFLEAGHQGKKHRHQRTSIMKNLNRKNKLAGGRPGACSKDFTEITDVPTLTARTCTPARADIVGLLGKFDQKNKERSVHVYRNQHEIPSVSDKKDGAKEGRHQMYCFGPYSNLRESAEHDCLEEVGVRRPLFGHWIEWSEDKWHGSFDHPLVLDGIPSTTAFDTSQLYVQIEALQDGQFRWKWFTASGGPSSSSSERSLLAGEEELPRSGQRGPSPSRTARPEGSTPSEQQEDHSPLHGSSGDGEQEDLLEKELRTYQEKAAAPECCDPGSAKEDSNAVAMLQEIMDPNEHERGRGRPLKDGAEEVVVPQHREHQVHLTSTFLEGGNPKQPCPDELTPITDMGPVTNEFCSNPPGALDKHHGLLTKRRPDDRKWVHVLYEANTETSPSYDEIRHEPFGPNGGRFEQFCFGPYEKDIPRSAEFGCLAKWEDSFRAKLVSLFSPDDAKDIPVDVDWETGKTVHGISLETDFDTAQLYVQVTAKADGNFEWQWFTAAGPPSTSVQRPLPSRPASTEAASSVDEKEGSGAPDDGAGEQQGEQEGSGAPDDGAGEQLDNSLNEATTYEEKDATPGCCGESGTVDSVAVLSSATNSFLERQGGQKEEEEEVQPSREQVAEEKTQQLPRSAANNEEAVENNRKNERTLEDGAAAGVRATRSSFSLAGEEDQSSSAVQELHVAV